MKGWLSKAVFLEIFLILVLSLTPLLWFQPRETMVGHDHVFPLEPVRFFEGRLFTWIENHNFGQSQSLIMGTIPVHLIDTLPSLVGLSLASTQKLVFIFWFFLIGLAAYLLAHTLRPKSRFFKLWAVVFYQFNFFVLQAWFINERTKFSAYVALPLVLAVFYQVYRQKISALKGAIVSGLILFFFNGGGLYGWPLFGGFLVCLGVFALFFTAVSFYRKQKQLGLSLITFLVLTGLFWLLLNAYYLWPAFSQLAASYGAQLGKVGGVSGVLAWAREISSGANLVNLFRLQGVSEWYDNPEHPYARHFLANPLLIGLSFLWPLLIVLAWFVPIARKDRKILIYFGLTFLVSFVFVAGVHYPFGFFYTLLVKYLPGFSIFRSPYFKFAPALFLSAAFLSGFALDYLKVKFNSLVQKVLRLNFGVVIFSLFWLLLWLGYHFPYFTTNFFQWRQGFTTRLEIPEHVALFSDWVENQWANDGRILILPASDSDWQYQLYQWGYLSFEPLHRLYTNQSLMTIGQGLTETDKYLVSSVNQAIIKKDKQALEVAAELLGINYLLVRGDFHWDLGWSKTDNPQLLVNILENNFGFQPEKVFGPWRLFKITTAPVAKLDSFSKFSVVYFPEKQLLKYYRLAADSRQGILLNTGLDLPMAMTSDFYYTPKCLNCGHETGLNVVFPEVRVLPDSPFYPLVKVKEARTGALGDVKAQIYNQLGLTLKRIGELEKLKELGRGIEIEYLDSFSGDVNQIGVLFGQLEAFDDQFRVAEDISFFLGEERQFFSDLFPTLASDSEKTAKVRQIVSEIDALEIIIDPFLFKRDRSHQRLYYFNLPQEGSFDLLVNARGISDGVSAGQEVNWSLDQGSLESVLISQQALSQEWLFISKLDLTPGPHRLFFSLPALPNLVGPLQTGEKFYGSEFGSCFSSKIAGYDSEKDYLLNYYYYQGDFPYEPKVFILREGQAVKDNERIQAVTIKEGGFFEEIIRGNERTRSAMVSVCVPEVLTEAAFSQRRMSLKTQEIIYPLLVLRQKAISGAKDAATPEIESQRINPTRYRLKVKNAQSPYLIGFWQKFDPSWRLKGDNGKPASLTHLVFNGYGNAWLVDQAGSYDLILEYRPQRYFYYGVGVSLLTFGLLVTYLVLKRQSK